MSPNKRTVLMTQLVANCTFPKPAEVQDQTCLICHVDTLGTNGGEPPVKLECGHILGIACLSAWVFEQVEQHGRSSPSCPFCSAPLLTPEGRVQVAFSYGNFPWAITIWSLFAAWFGGYAYLQGLHWVRTVIGFLVIGFVAILIYPDD